MWDMGVSRSWGLSNRWIVQWIHTRFSSLQILRFRSSNRLKLYLKRFLPIFRTWIAFPQIDLAINGVVILRVDTWPSIINFDLNWLEDRSIKLLPWDNKLSPFHWNTPRDGYSHLCLHPSPQHEFKCISWLVRHIFMPSDHIIPTSLYHFDAYTHSGMARSEAPKLQKRTTYNWRRYILRQSLKYK